MRIIAGEHRGRRIDAPRGRSTRPMLDRVREALFGSLDAGLPDARVLDLFAGSGSLGLEALSRGAASARMIESDRATLRTLSANVEALGVADRADVVRGDALDPVLWPDADGEPYDLVLLDPPYAMFEQAGSRATLLERLEQLRTCLVAGGQVVLHVPRRAAEQAALEARGFRVRSYGSSALVFVPSLPHDSTAGAEEVA